MTMMDAVVISAVGNAKVQRVSAHMADLVVPYLEPITASFRREEETIPTVGMNQVHLQRHTVSDGLRDYPVFWPAGWPDAWGLEAFKRWQAAQ